ncbi:MAG: PepSY domain-containing protein [Roseovarius sp.]
MKPLLPLLLAAALLAGALPALSDGDEQDHDRAREALERGEVLPLSQILEIAELEGRVIEVDFERDDGRWVYELELITPEGRLVEIEVDGATGAVLEREEEDD